MRNELDELKAALQRWLACCPILPGLPVAEPRRTFVDCLNDEKTCVESDRDYLENNAQSAVALLETYQEAQRVQKNEEV